MQPSKFDFATTNKKPHMLSSLTVQGVRTYPSLPWPDLVFSHFNCLAARSPLPSLF